MWKRALAVVIGAGVLVWAGALAYGVLRAAAAAGAATVPPALGALAADLRGSPLSWLLVALALVPLVALIAKALDDEPERPRLGKRLREFLGAAAADPAALTLRSETFEPSQLPDLDAALDALGAEPGARETRLGWVAERYSTQNPHLAAMVGGKHGITGDDSDIATGPVEERVFPVGPGEERSCLWRGVRLIEASGARLVVQVRHEESFSGVLSGLVLEVASTAREAAERLQAFVAEHLARRSVYAGKVISLESSREPWSTEAARNLGIAFHRFEPVRLDELILPPATRELLERSTVGFVRQRPHLRRLGRAMRRGILLHGPPGTGKTLAIRWLAHALPGHTTLVAIGASQGLLGAYFRLARTLAPALLVFEDIDLVAQDRRDGGRADPAILNQLLNELDGMREDADVIVVLTTNHPDALEPALVARPGRVDQSIEFPLPDAECRRRLFELYARGLTLGLEREEDLVARTEGASAAFLKELFRRAALTAVERGGGDGAEGDLTVRDADLDRALRELTLSGNELTRRLLGFGG